MNFRNWLRPLAAIVVAVGLGVPAFAAVYEKAGLIVPPGTHIKAGDNSALRLGDGSLASDPGSYDVSIRWDGTDLDILANADDQAWNFGNGTNSWDVKFFGDTTATYILWDASADDLFFQDNVSAKFGNDGDVEIRWDGTNMDVLAATDDYQIYWGDGTKSFDFRYYGNAAGEYISWDASANDLKFEDSVSLMFGTGSAAGQGAAGDVEMRWDGTDFDVLAAADDSIIKWGNGTNSFDQWWYGQTANTYISWDASADDLKFEDSTSLMFGTGSAAGPGAAGDVEMRWDGTDFDVLAAADDQIWKFGNGTNSWDIWVYGNTSADYLLVDASANTISSEGDFQFVLNDFKRRLAAKTTDFSVPATESGSVYTTTGSTTGVNFTLPTSAAGLQYEFLQIADATMTVTCPADTCVIFNDAAADSVSFVTTSEMIGNSVRAFGDGTKWFLEIIRASDSVSVTTAT